MSTEEVFEELSKEKEASEDCARGPHAREIIQEMNLKFDNSQTMVDFTEQKEEEFVEAMLATCALADEDTKNAKSISRSGPTSQGADNEYQQAALSLSVPSLS